MFLFPSHMTRVLTVDFVFRSIVESEPSWSLYFLVFIDSAIPFFFSSPIILHPALLLESTGGNFGVCFGTTKYYFSFFKLASYGGIALLLYLGERGEAPDFLYFSSSILYHRRLS